MKALIDTPKESVLLVPEVYKDTRLGSQQTRWNLAIFYGFLRRTFNLSLNHLASHFSKKYHDVYIINRIDTIEQRTGFGKTTIIKYFKILEKFGYITRHYNKIKHVDLIFMPKVMKDHLTDPSILDGYDLSGSVNEQGLFTKRTSLVHQVNRAGSPSEPRCKDHVSKDQIVKDQTVHVQDKTTKQKLNNWISNYGLPKSVVDLVKSNSKSINDALTKVKNITGLKNSINMKYKGVYYSDYFKNEKNPYIQNGGLMKSLKTVFNDHKDLKETITKDYKKYIDDNSDLVPRNNGHHKKIVQKLPDWAKAGYKPKLHPLSKTQSNKVELQEASMDIDRDHLNISPKDLVNLKNNIKAKLEVGHKVTDLNECNFNGKAYKEAVKQVKATDAKEAKLKNEAKAKEDSQNTDNDSLNPFTKSSEVAKADQKSDQPANDTNDLYSFMTDEGMNQYHLKEDLVTYYEAKAEIDDAKESNSDSVTELNPNLSDFNGQTINQLNDQIDQLKFRIKDYENPMTDNVIDQITKDAKSTVDNNMKDPEPDKSTNEPKEPVDVPF